MLNNMIKKTDIEKEQDRIHNNRIKRRLYIREYYQKNKDIILTKHKIWYNKNVKADYAERKKYVSSLSPDMLLAFVRNELDYKGRTTKKINIQEELK